jgi:hypothetical protein
MKDENKMKESYERTLRLEYEIKVLYLYIKKSSAIIWWKISDALGRN